jgi:hypothetical protein
MSGKPESGHTDGSGSAPRRAWKRPGCPGVAPGDGARPPVVGRHGWGRVSSVRPGAAPGGGRPLLAAGVSPGHGARQSVAGPPKKPDRLPCDTLRNWGKGAPPAGDVRREVRGVWSTQSNQAVELTAHSAGFFGGARLLVCGPQLTASVRLLTGHP